jgi:hypothetical protein
MKLLSIAFSLVFAGGFIQTAAGITCPSGCVACWKIGSPGIDIKMGATPTPTLIAGDECPSGYEGIHCASSRRCM